MRLATNLIDICYDCRSGIRDTPGQGHLDIDGITDQLLGLRNLLDDLFRAATTAGVKSLAAMTLESSGNAIDGLLVKCREEVNELEFALTQADGREWCGGPSSSFNSEGILSRLALSTSALRGVIDGGQQYVSHSLT